MPEVALTCQVAEMVGQAQLGAAGDLGADVERRLDVGVRRLEVAAVWLAVQVPGT